MLDLRRISLFFPNKRYLLMIRTIALLSAALLVAPCTVATSNPTAACQCNPCKCDPCECKEGDCKDETACCKEECTTPCAEQCDSTCQTTCTKSKRCPCEDFAGKYVAAGCGTTEQVNAFLESLSEAEFGEFVARLESAEAPLSEELANKISAALNIDANALPEISCSSCK